MADADFTGLLIHTCDIQRKNVTGTDAHGQRVFTWYDLETDVACRFEGRESLNRIRSIEVVDASRHTVGEVSCSFESTLDLTEDDRIVRSDGRIYNVLLVTAAEDDSVIHHYEVSLDEVRSAT